MVCGKDNTTVSYAALQYIVPCIVYIIPFIIPVFALISDYYCYHILIDISVVIIFKHLILISIIKINNKRIKEFQVLEDK